MEIPQKLKEKIQALQKDWEKFKDWNEEGNLAISGNGFFTIENDIEDLMDFVKDTPKAPYILGVSGSSWHYQEREDWKLQDNLDDPKNPFVSTSTLSGSGLTEEEARLLVKTGCICYDLSEEGLSGAVAACSLPTRSFDKSDMDYALKVWEALWELSKKFPKMKLGVAKEDYKFPWE